MYSVISKPDLRHFRKKLARTQAYVQFKLRRAAALYNLQANIFLARNGNEALVSLNHSELQKSVVLADSSSWTMDGPCIAFSPMKQEARTNRSQRQILAIVLVNWLDASIGHVHA